MTLYFDKLIDRYIPTDSGWNFHPDNTATLTAVMEEGVIDKLVIDQANPLPHEYKQLMYSNISGSGNASVYYLDMITSKDSGTLPTIERDLAASNAKAIKLAPNTTMIFKTNYPYNKDRLKKVLCRCRKAAADTELTLHVGVIGIEDKAYKQPDGTYGNTSFYEVVVSGEVTGSYVTYVGYVLDTDSVEGIETALLSHPRPNNDPDYPAKLLDDTTDIALMIKTGAGGAGENEFIYVDSIELQDTENALTELPQGAMVINSLEGLTDDNKLSPIEKTYVKTLMTEIDAVYAGALADGTAAGVSSTLLTALTTKWNALHAIVDPVLADMTTASNITAAFDTAFSEYYSAKTAVQSETSNLNSASLSLSLNADTGVILFTARGVLVTEEIKLTIVSTNIPIANVTISRSDAGALTKIDNYHYTLDCSTVMADTITVGVTATYLDKSYSSVVSVTKYVDPSITPYNFGGLSEVPSLLPDGGWLVTGDYFLWAESNTPAGSTAAPVVAYPNLVKGEIYEYNGTAWVKSSNGNLVMTMFDSYAQLQNDYDTAVIGAAVIKKLVAIDAFIQNLNAENLTTGTGNGATGGFRFRAKSRTDLSLPYDETTNPSVFDVMYDNRKVFEVDSESGNVMFGDYAAGNGLRWENSTSTLSVMGSGKFTGTMDHEALTTMDAVASQISVNFATKTAYYGQDLYNGLASIGTGAWVPATGTFDGIGFSRIARLETTEQTAIIVDSSVPNDGELQFVSKYTGSVRFIFEARPGMVSSGTVNLYINGELISSTYRAAFSGATVVTVDRNVAEGDIVKMTTSGNEIYFKMYIRGVGLALDMGSRYISIKTIHYYDDRFLSSSPVAIDSNSYMTYNSAEGIIGALAALTPNRDHPTVSGSTISVSGGVSKSVESIMRSSETVVIKTSSEIVYLSTSMQEGVSGYNLSGIITVDTSEASLRTLTVLPKQDNTHSLGSIGFNLYYADLFVSSLVGMISAFASSAAPSGWLECNGQAVSRSTYSKLYSAIGTTFGAGNGSTTFNVPDLRGEFIRGWSHGRSGVDDGRTVGSFQDQSIQSHAHSYTFTDVTHSAGDNGNDGSRCVEKGATTGYAGGAETRPRNIALMYCIKY